MDMKISPKFSGDPGKQFLQNKAKDFDDKLRRLFLLLVSAHPRYDHVGRSLRRKSVLRKSVGRVNQKRNGS